MGLTAVAHTKAGELRTSVDVNGRHVIETDEPVRLGGTDVGPAPHELLPAALAACVATMITMYARTKGWALGDVHVDVDYDPQAVPRQVRVEIHLPATLSHTQVARLTRVADTCPIRRALETGFAFEEHVVLEPRDQPRRAA